MDLRPTISNREFFSAKTPEATAFALEDRYAFLIASCLDRGTRSDMIRTVPYDLKQRLGALVVVAIAEMPLRRLDGIVRALPHKPRCVSAAPRTILDLSRMIRDKFGGRAGKMWEGRSSGRFQSDLRTIHGVGPGIVGMTANLVFRLHGDVFSRDGLHAVDLKPDMHTRRVLYGLGIAAMDSDNAALKAARRRNPPYPGGTRRPSMVGRPSAVPSRAGLQAMPAGTSMRLRPPAFLLTRPWFQPRFFGLLRLQPGFPHPNIWHA